MLLAKGLAKSGNPSCLRFKTGPPRSKVEDQAVSGSRQVHQGPRLKIKVQEQGGRGPRKKHIITGKRLPKFYFWGVHFIPTSDQEKLRSSRQGWGTLGIPYKGRAAKILSFGTQKSLHPRGSAAKILILGCWFLVYRRADTALWTPTLLGSTAELAENFKFGLE